MSLIGLDSLDPRRQRCYRLLRLIGEGAAEFYRDAVLILESGTEAGSGAASPPFNAATRRLPSLGLRAPTHLVAHLFREIESAMRDVLLPAGHIRPKAEAHKAEIQAILGSLNIADSPIAATWLGLTGDSGLQGRAHRDSLAAPRALGEEERRYFSDVEAVFDGVLQSFEENFNRWLLIVDELLATATPSNAEINRLRGKVPQNLVTLGRFFSRADARWLHLLEEAEFFLHPPGAILDEYGEPTAYPPWPAILYLSRLAQIPEMQAEIARIASAIPETANVLVVEDLSALVLSLPVDQSIAFVPRLKRALSGSRGGRVQEHLAGLMTKFSESGMVDEALDLASHLLTSALPGRRPHGSWEFRELLAKAIPPIVTRTGLRGVGLLAETLTAALEEASARGERDSPSYIWRPAIEPHEQNWVHMEDPRDAAIDALRDAAVPLCDSEEMTRQVVATLEATKSRVHLRIVLHLLRVVPAAPLDLAKGFLMRSALLRSSDMWHEYSLLAVSVMPRLSPHDAGKILQAAVRFAKTRATEWSSEQGASAAEAAERLRLEEWQQLGRFAGALPARWARRYQVLEAEFGQPEHPDLLHSSRSFVGPSSPRSAEELRELSIEQLVSYLRSWQPARGFMEASPEGLGRELGKRVAEDPASFAEAAPAFASLEPTYGRALLTALCEVAKEGRSFPWPPVVNLCELIVASGPSEPSSGMPDQDLTWAFTRRVIAQLLEEGLSERDSSSASHTGPSFEMRAQLWPLIEALGADPDPTPYREAFHGGSNQETFSLALNTTRGAALSAAVKYGLWVKRHLGSDYAGLGSLPELSRFLEEHLDSSVEPSIAVRSGYGRWFPWLHLLDPAWAVASVPKIFPVEPSEARLLTAAWDSYIVLCPAYDDILQPLYGEYQRAVVRMADPSADSSDSAGNELAQHLMLYYLRGLLELRDPLLTGFFDHVPAKLRSQALDSVGRILHFSEKLAPAVRARGMALWDTRGSDPQATAPFAWFFGSTLDVEWRLSSLHAALTRNPILEPDHVVLEELAKLAPHHPLETIVCARLIVDGAREDWRIMSWRADLRAVISACLASRSAEAADRARALASVLVARGFPEFADLP